MSPRWRRRLYFFLGGSVLAAGIAALTGVAVLRSDWFRDYVRRRAIAEVQRATGGRAELEGVAIHWKALRAEVRGFTLHGLEKEGEPPLARVERVEAGLRILSPLRREVYLAELRVEKPRIRVVTYADGSTNVPKPKIRRVGGRPWPEQLLALRVKRFSAVDGTFEYDTRRIPLHVEGEQLKADLTYDAGHPAYRGGVSVRQLRVRHPAIETLRFDGEFSVGFHKDGLTISKLAVTSPASRVEGSGELRDWRSPRLEAAVTARAGLREMAPLLHLPISPLGEAGFRGKVWLSGAGVTVEGPVTAKGLAYRDHGIEIENASLEGHARLENRELAVTGIEARALDGVFRGRAALHNLRNLDLSGTVDGFSLAALGGIPVEARPVAWSGTVRGPVSIQGPLDSVTVEARLTVSPGTGPLPVEGAVNLRYSQKDRRIDLPETRLRTPNSAVEVTGTVGGRLAVRVETRSLDDFLPAVELAAGKPPDPLPVKLADGEAVFEGHVAGALDEPVVDGLLRARNVVYGGYKLDRASAGVRYTRRLLEADRLTVEQNGLRLSGSGSLTLLDGKPAETSRVRARLTLEGATLERLLEQAGRKLPVTGRLSGVFEAGGTLRHPEVGGRAVVDKGSFHGELVDRLRVDGKYREGLVEVESGDASKNGSQVQFAGRYEYAPEDIGRGRGRLTVSAKAVNLESVAALRARYPEIAARADVKLEGAFRAEPGSVALESIEGTAAFGGLAVSGRQVGSLRLQARTNGNVVSVAASGDVRGAAFRGAGEWQLSGDHPGLGHVDVAPLALSEIQKLLTPAGGTAKDLPFTGEVAASVVVVGSLRRPTTLRARIDLPRLELRPRVDRPVIGTVRAEDLNLRNERPLVFEAGHRGVQVVEARMIGKDTNLEASGMVSFTARNPWNLQVRGGLNLAVLQEFFPGLQSSGVATLNATVKGTLRSPELNGRMELKNASAYYRDMPNGVDNANGLVLFDNNRAVLQNLKAQTGGGEVTVNGFVTLAQDDIVYRLQMQAERVRVRYPEGASTTVDANLNLAGNRDRSLLGGTLTILRSGFTPRTDIASMLLQPARPAGTPESSNAFLQGMQFDLRVENAPNLQLETSLTQGIMAEVDLRLRGSPAKPVLLGRITATQGEIYFFGNKYTISRGDVAFFNPARLEPVVDLDLETKVRAVTVNLTVSGPLNKLNVTYRSDPPLQSSEIIALLAVGRAPASNPTIAGVQNISTAGAFTGGTESLIGQAVAAGVSSRLQRFFGVSRLKIDPQLTGLDTTPQARLTLEQQISREITITYVTNLTGTNQQLLRLQWDLRREWSVLAVRDENGFFGLNILYQKRFR